MTKRKVCAKRKRLAQALLNFNMQQPAKTATVYSKDDAGAPFQNVRRWRMDS